MRHPVVVSAFEQSSGQWSRDSQALIDIPDMRGATIRAMKWRLSSVLLCACTALVHAAGSDSIPTAKPEEVGLSSARLDRIAQVLRGEMAAVAALVLAERSEGGGTPGEFLWSGAQGTMFWVDPQSHDGSRTHSLLCPGRASHASNPG
jgi:hypothetical protein